MAVARASQNRVVYQILRALRTLMMTRIAATLSALPTKTGPRLQEHAAVDVIHVQRDEPLANKPGSRKVGVRLSEMSHQLFPCHGKRHHELAYHPEPLIHPPPSVEVHSGQVTGDEVSEIAVDKGELLMPNPDEPVAAGQRRQDVLRFLGETHPEVKAMPTVG